MSRKVVLTASLYVHIPFCSAKCAYCDFYSLPVDAKIDRPLLDGFLRQLCLDIERQLRFVGVTNIGTVYIGGGTPSVLGTERLADLLAFLQSRLPNIPSEFTVEANPESLDAPFLRACADGGVTRISCGVQSFDGAARVAVGRRGDADGVHAALALLGEAYADAFSADLISGLPFQTEAGLLRDIETLLRYKPAHVSLYDLTLEERTPLYRNAALRRLLPPQDEAAARWLAGRGLLQEAGYAQYEASSFAPEGKRSRHNIVYWRMGCWLGAGPSASGTLIWREGREARAGAGGGTARGIRRTEAADALRYSYPEAEADGEGDGEGSVEVEALDAFTLIKETFLMGYRYIEGPDEALFADRFGCRIDSLIPRTLDRWRRDGRMRPDASALNGEGLLFLNRFLADCFAELDGNGTEARFARLV
jgi:oxygen-independent coproporphyrinogen-3 oxidase